MSPLDKQTKSVPFRIMQVCLVFFSSHPFKMYAFLNFRGSLTDPGINHNGGQIQNRHNSNIIETDPSTISIPAQNTPQLVPTIQDVFVCYATSPNYASLRDPQEGTLLISAFVETFAMHSHNTDLDDLMKLVQTKINRISNEYRVENRLFQTIDFRQLGPTKKFYINPGLYRTRNRALSENSYFDNKS